ncbi:uncharacterized protein, partial [Rutidosis leptorrhynchoides]|uniref:uncharacterized protein n=1 Tax=Rutidosis leptorrhynchoides TaxID=125765 RepID=UPI003A99F059
LNINQIKLSLSSDSFLIATFSIWSFTRLRSLHIHLSLLNTGSFNFKWKVKVSNRVDSFLFLSPISIYSSDTYTSLTGVDESSLVNEVEEDALSNLDKKFNPRLPVSGYVMKGVTLVLVERDDVHDESYINVDDDDSDKDDGLELDKEAAAYREALIEIFKEQRGSIKGLPLVELM